MKDVFKLAEEAQPEVTVPVGNGNNKKKDYEAVAFLNFKINIKQEIDGEEVLLQYTPKGATFNRKWVADPDNAKKWAAITSEGGVDKLVCDYRIVKGDELKRIELDKLAENLSDELRALLRTVQAQANDQSYSRYLKIVGDLYIVTKTGVKRKLNGVFPPSLDFRIGNEASTLENQIHLVNAVLNGHDIEWTIQDLTMYAPEDESEDEY